MTNSWKNFSILYSIQFIQLLDFMSISPLGAILVKDHKIDSDTISFTLASYSIAAIFSSFFVGQFGREKPKKTLFTLVAVFSCSQLFLMFPITPILFIATKTLGGLTGGLMGAIAYSQISNIEGGKSTGLWNGRIQTAQSLATILGIPFCLLIVTKFGSTSYFFIMALWGFITLYFFSKASFFSSSSVSGKGMSRDFVIKNLDVVITGFFCYLSAFLFISQLANYLVNSLYVSSIQLSIAYSVSGCLTLILAGHIGQIGEHYPAKKLLIISLAIITIPQLIFRNSTNNYILLFSALPIYLLLSNARAIYQRAIILQKATADSFQLHLLNNIAVRTGILSSGLMLGLAASTEKNLSELFIHANDMSIICNVGLVMGLGWMLRFKDSK